MKLNQIQNKKQFARYFLLSMLMVISQVAFAQYASVRFNYERSYFNDGQPLPAEAEFMVTGTAPRSVQMIGIIILKPGTGKIYHQTLWKRSFGNQTDQFNIPLNYKLRGSSEYDIKINYYRQASAEERENLKTLLFGILNSYIDQSYIVSKRRISLKKSHQATLSNLNDLVISGLQYYQSKSEISFTGFSSLVNERLKDTESMKLKGGKYYFDPDSISGKSDARFHMSRKMIEELKLMIESEALSAINADLHVIADSKRVNSYPTEKTRNVLALNAGFGGIYLSGDVSDLSYDTSPYAGLSFPLGNAAFASPFWSKTALSFGLFLSNITDENGLIVSGPLVDRPLYAGLGYNAFRYFRVNAGAAFLESKKSGANGLDLSEVFIRPYVGFSVELHMWLGLSR